MQKIKLIERKGRKLKGQALQDEINSELAKLDDFRTLQVLNAIYALQEMDEPNATNEWIKFSEMSLDTLRNKRPELIAIDFNGFTSAALIQIKETKK